MTSGLQLPPGYSVHWIRDEVAASLLRVRQAVEACADRGTTEEKRDLVAYELDTLASISRVLPWLSLQLAFDEMRRTWDVAGRLPEAEAESGFSALLSGCILLPDYLDLLAEGTPDRPLLLLPLLNELRLAAGQPLLTESEVFVLQRQGEAPLPRHVEPTASAEQAPVWARKLLPHYLAAVQSIARDHPESRRSIGRVGKIAEQMAQVVQDARLHQLWRTVAAIAEALLGLALESSSELRRQLGAAGALLRSLGERGEAAALEQAGSLADQLLYFVARSRGRGPRVASLRQDARLAELLPEAELLEQQRTQLRGPNVSLLQQVVAEIRSDLTEAKDAIDLAVRAGRSEQLDATRERLRQVSRTLSALGLETLSRAISQQASVLDAAPDALADLPWMDLATRLLDIELSLDDALFRQLRGLPELPLALDAVASDQRRPPHARDLREGAARLVREALVELSRAKLGIDALFRQSQTAALPEAAQQLHRVAGSLRVLDQAEAALLTERVAVLVADEGFAALCQTPSDANRFADALTALEVHIEALRDGLPENPVLLQQVDSGLQHLQSQLLLRAPPPLPEAAPEAVVADEIDPEIRDIFVEEAGDVAALLDQTVPGWARQPERHEALLTIRRAFHTLKGSGRMVGAGAIGEFGWAIERLLNRCIEGAVPLSPQVIDLVVAAQALLPALISGFQRAEAPPEALAALVARAETLAEGQATADPEMVAIFRDDAHEKLSQVQQWLGSEPGDEVPEFLVRAFHTLRGSAALVGVPATAAIGTAVETWLNSLRSGALAISTEQRESLGELVAELQTWVDLAGTPEGRQLDAAPWLARIEAWRVAVPEGLRDQGVASELADIFSMEALDLVEQMETVAQDWAAAPERAGPVAQLAVLTHTLAGAASMSAAPAIAEVAKALQSRLLALGEHAPAPVFFAALGEVIEGLRQQLDAYRDQQLPGHDPARLAQVAALGGDAEAEALADTRPEGAAPEVLVMELATPQEAETGDAPAFGAALPAEAVADAGADAAGIETEAADGETLALSSTLDAGVFDPLRDELVAPPPLAAEAAAAAEAAEIDDLQGIFLDEARELLEAMDRLTASWERDPGDPAAGEDLRRVLHTLKGSARVAGHAGLGEVAARLETAVQDALQQSPQRGMFARLQLAVDRLHVAVDGLAQGRLPDVEALLRDADITAVEAAPVAVAPPPPAPVTATARRTAAAAPVDEDDELAEVFLAEAAELLEALDAAMARLRQRPDDPAPRRDMLRVLHTFKGGARMSGMVAMGDRAHAFEALLEALQEREDPLLDAATVETLAAEVDALHHWLERWRDGDRSETPLPEPDAVLTAAADDRETAVPAFEGEGAAPDAASLPEAAAPQAVAPTTWDPRLFWRPEDDLAELSALRQETARVPVERLDGMLNEVGEISIYRSRLEEQVAGLQTQLNEMTQAIGRLRDQLRQMDAETDAQISARGLDAATPEQDRYAGDFDPLEMDRYTRMQELSRALNESVGDLSGLQLSMETLVAESEGLLLQQSRINSSVQQGLMSTLMVPFSRQIGRLQRVVRAAALERGKQAVLVVEGEGAELDRNVLERMTAPLEHLLRNAVVHGIESPEVRAAAGKPPVGDVRLRLQREGSQLALELVDDGGGLDYDSIEQVAIRRGLLAAPLPADAPQREADLAGFIFEPGFSTARELTQDAGRGIGMDVVASEVKQLGGTLVVSAERGRGTRFQIRLPLTLAVSQALLVSVGDELYALPLANVEGIVRITPAALASHLAEDGPPFLYGDQSFRVRYLGDYLGIPPSVDLLGRTVHAVLIRSPEGATGGMRRLAVVIDEMLGNREIVSKPVGPLISSVNGISSATILSDGRVVLILDVAALVQARARRARVSRVTSDDDTRLLPLAMVVDDSITIRRVTERLLTRNGYRVATAKDGLDAMAQLQSVVPAVVLLDIEMPRADGFEVASFIRNNDRLREVPIVMITSRSGDKHRARADAIGVNRYLIKPYQEDQLMGELRGVLSGDEA
jgi:chemosensory pili system protein ChpA (sensor histidine kinase/response regulator)